MDAKDVVRRDGWCLWHLALTVNFFWITFTKAIHLLSRKKVWWLEKVSGVSDQYELGASLGLKLRCYSWQVRRLQINFKSCSKQTSVRWQKFNAATFHQFEILGQSDIFLLREKSAWKQIKRWQSEVEFNHWIHRNIIIRLTNEIFIKSELIETLCNPNCTIPKCWMKYY